MNPQIIPASSGIYRITCTANGRFYIGSALNLYKRQKEHLNDLINNRHKNRKLQRAYLKYGRDAFIFEIVELVLLPEMLVVREQHYFDMLKPFGSRGFNIAKIAGSTLGIVPSLEKRRKIGESQRGRVAHNKGKKMTPEQLEKHRLARLGKKHSEERKRKAAQARRGTKHSLETREKMRLAALGHAPTNAKTFVVTGPDGIEHIVRGALPAFCKERNLSSSTLIQVARGKRKQHKGWRARYSDVADD